MSIRVHFLDSVPASMMSAIYSAVRRWEKIVVDLHDLGIEVKWSRNECPGSKGARSGPKNDNDEARSRLKLGWITFDEFANENDPEILVHLATHEIGHLLGFRKGVFLERELVERVDPGDGRWMSKSKYAADAANRSPLEDRRPILDLNSNKDEPATHWRECDSQSWHDIMEPRVWRNSAIGTQTTGVLRDIGYDVNDREIEEYRDLD